MAQPGRPPWRTPTLQRLREAGRDPRAFRAPAAQAWVVTGILLLVLTGLLPVLWPPARLLTERLAPLLSLAFLLAALGLWMGLGRRALLVAGVLALGFYGLTAWTRFAFADLHDLYVVGVLVGFLVYALAGFNLVFVLEELVYDGHRRLHLRGRFWMAVPLVLVGILALGLPLLAGQGGVWLGATWVVSLVALALLGSWWLLRDLHRLGAGPVLRELHLFVAGGLAAALLVDLLATVHHQADGLLSSVVAYVALLGTWLFVSYSALQRTHFLLRGRNVLPWLAILLSASFAVLWHAQLLYRVGGASELAVLLDRRVAFLVAGVWIGIAFFALRSIWRVLVYLRDESALGARARILAGRLARLAEAFFTTEARVGRIVLRGLWRLEASLPGRPLHPEWELDGRTGELRRLDEEE